MGWDERIARPRSVQQVADIIWFEYASGDFARHSYFTGFYSLSDVVIITVSSLAGGVFCAWFVSKKYKVG